MLTYLFYSKKSKYFSLENTTRKKRDHSLNQYNLEGKIETSLQSKTKN